jgi:UDP-N-acetylglucosamine 3-dehydrogenase
MSGERIGIGLIGLGTINRAHTRGYQESGERARIVAVCDINERAVAERSAALQCTGYADYLALLQDPVVDAVDITLPHHLHYRVARAALEHGKHVLVEKPMAATATECRELIDLARRSGLTFTVAENTRFVGAYMEAEKLVRAGELGAPRLIRTFIYGSEYERLTTTDDWITRKADAVGGVIIDCGAHSFYLIKWLFGEVEAVQAWQAAYVRGSEVEDWALISGTLRNGALFSVEFTATAEIPWGERCEIYGSKGSLIIDQLRNPPAVHFRGARDYEGVPLSGVPYNPQGWKYQSIVDEVKDFVAAIAERRPPATDPMDGCYSVMVVERAYESVAASGALITV